MLCDPCESTGLLLVNLKKLNSLLQNDDYAHKIKKIMSFKEDNYEILLYFNFYILLVD